MGCYGGFKIKEDSSEQRYDLIRTQLLDQMRLIRMINIKNAIVKHVLMISTNDETH